MFKYTKHIVHVVILYTFIACIEYGTLIQIKQLADKDEVQSLTIPGLILLALQLVILLPVPQMLCNLIGLTFFNAFPGEINIQVPSSQIVMAMSNSNQVNGSSLADDGDGHQGRGSFIKNNRQATRIASTPIKSLSSLPSPMDKLIKIPHLCFRVVTRGLYPELVHDNVRTNLRTCIESGLTNFSIEVVTDKDIHISPDQDGRVRQIVVPTRYESSTRAKFKARALQYALEPGTSTVQDEDYIVHLDEETIITKNVICGIINFALDGKHAFGQGLITYANLGIVNLFTTLADSFRVADDMGKIRFTLGGLHRPIFGWKGSFVVTKCQAERDVSFDHGDDGSIAEDCYFSMIAYNKDYTFDFIQGEMYEKSPFTLMDLIKQRKRWLQGIWLVVCSPKIPWRTKFFLSISLYSWLTLPITSLSMINIVIVVPWSYYLRPLGAFCFATTVYMYLFGLVKSFDLKKQPVGIFFAYLIAQLLTVSLYSIVENVVVVWGIFSNKHNFYIVKKDNQHKATNSKAAIMAKF